MSKWTGSLSYKDWCILKHSVDRSIEAKQTELVIDTLISTNNMTLEKKETLQKELEEEKKTLERVTELTDNFKKYIKGHGYY
ncbi:hypothetical protein [Clostridium tagluense]|uniref:hypothetical protein n=1 Tax=Clostridium tagluense TaxID=360422 RepID=UPI001CF5B38B|nr:hypothetical protein [Clostridium tagluense]MCB2300371.1 hypothetical protein [Clostridium tagluense]